PYTTLFRSLVDGGKSLAGNAPARPEVDQDDAVLDGLVVVRCGQGDSSHARSNAHPACGIPGSGGGDPAHPAGGAGQVPGWIWTVRACAGGSQAPGSATCCSPLRLALTSSAAPSAPGTRTKGTPRRSA